MPFKPGQSGNPAGRPRQKPFLDWAGRWTVEKAEKYLAPIAEDTRIGNRRTALEAIKLIMAYGVGKPVEFAETSVEFEGVPTDPNSVKGYLDDLISGAAAKGPGTNPADAKPEGDSAPEVLDTQREARGSDSGGGEA